MRAEDQCSPSLHLGITEPSELHEIWSWEVGMVTAGGWIVVDVGSDEFLLLCRTRTPTQPKIIPKHQVRPNMRHPTTCALVEQFLLEPHGVRVVPGSDGRWVLKDLHCFPLLPEYARLLPEVVPASRPHAVVLALVMLHRWYLERTPSCTASSLQAPGISVPA